MGDCGCGATVCQPYRLMQHVKLQRIQIYAFHTAVAPVAAQYPMIKVINTDKSALHAHHMCWQTASIPGVLEFAHRLVFFGGYQGGGLPPAGHTQRKRRTRLPRDWSVFCPRHGPDVFGWPGCCPPCLHSIRAVSVAYAFCCTMMLLPAPAHTSLGSVYSRR
jgi:hypothetical protein